MDLFSSANVNTIENPLPDLDNWVEYFSQSELYQIEHIMKTVLAMRGQGKIVYPEQNDILKIFRNMTPDKLRIVILGQDPYFDGNATGYAFAAKNRMTPSLRKIRETIMDTCVLRYHETYETRADASLQYLVNQGVMLLNTSLTVERNKPGSHKHLGWESIIMKFLERLSKKKKHLIFMLWGNYAQNVGKVIDPTNNYIKIAMHPAAAARNNIKWKHNHFQEADYDLMRHEYDRIRWI